MVTRYNAEVVFMSRVCLCSRVGSDGGIIDRGNCYPIDIIGALLYQNIGRVRRMVDPVQKEVSIS